MNRLTLDEIATQAGVSRSTVSRVVNNHPSVRPDVRLRIQKIIHETGFQPNAAAQSLANQRSYMIGLVIPKSINTIFSDPYFPRLTEGVAQGCNQHHYTLSLYIEYDEENLLPRITRRGLLDGLIVQVSTIDDVLISKLSRADIPIVALGRPGTCTDVSFVDVDNKQGAYSAVAHLISLGRKRLATITGPLTSSTGIDRLEGYRRAVSERGNSLKVSLEAQGDFTELGAYFAAKSLLSQKPDAIFAASDIMARGAIRAIQEAGLCVPGDVAVVGFDDLPPATMVSPLLTTVRQPVKRLGTIAVDTLIDLIEHGADLPRKLVFDTQLIIRESCGGSLQKYA
jgi:LacI family transcriptional regulator